MALFEVDEAASKIRNEVDENANIIFGSSIDNNLEGIIKVSVVATGINKNENQNYFENKDLDIEKEDYENKEETISIDEHIEILEKKNVDQIDLESEITRLDVKEENKLIKDGNDSSLNINNKELKSIFENKPDNQFTQSQPKT